MTLLGPIPAKLPPGQSRFHLIQIDFVPPYLQPQKQDFMNIPACTLRLPQRFFRKCWPTLSFMTASLVLGLIRK